MFPEQAACWEEEQSPEKECTENDLEMNQDHQLDRSSSSCSYSSCLLETINLFAGLIYLLLYLVSCCQCMMLAYSIGICVDEKYKKLYRESSSETIDGYVVDVTTSTRTIVSGPEGEYTNDQGYIPHENEHRKQVMSTTWTVQYKCNETVYQITTTTPPGRSAQVGDTVNVSVLEDFSRSGRVTTDTTNPPPSLKERLKFVFGGLLFGVMLSIAAVAIVDEFVVSLPITVSSVGAVYGMQFLLATLVTTVWYSLFWSVRYRAKRVPENQVCSYLQGDEMNTSTSAQSGPYCYCKTSGSLQMFP